jgi:hypothetical protein
MINQNSNVVREFPPRNRPLQTSEDRLIRIESKLTKVVKAFGVDVSGFDPDSYPHRVVLAVDDNNNETLNALHLQVTLLEIYDAAQWLDVDFPVVIALQGKIIGKLNALHPNNQPQSAA